MTKKVSHRMVNTMPKEGVAGIPLPKPKPVASKNVGVSDVIVQGAASRRPGNILLTRPMTRERTVREHKGTRRTIVIQGGAQLDCHVGTCASCDNPGNLLDGEGLWHCAGVSSLLNSSPSY